jgi:adenosylhomocysteine nucleosidase
MPRVAIVAALEREVSRLTRTCRRVQQQYEGRSFVFFEQDDAVVVCGGIGLDAARRASEAVIALYRPTLLQSVGFAGALDADLRVGDLFTPSVVIDARDGSRVQIQHKGKDEDKNEDGRREHSLVTFMAVAGAKQKASLSHAYGAKAVDMEAAAVAAAAHAHGIPFSATKVISDDSSFELPEMARFIDSQGRFHTARFAAFVALRPWLWSRVATLASNSRNAAKILGEHLQRFHQELSRESRQASAPAAEDTAPPAPSRAGGRQ